MKCSRKTTDEMRQKNTRNALHARCSSRSAGTHRIRKIQQHFGRHAPLLQREKPHSTAAGGVGLPAGGGEPAQNVTKIQRGKRCTTRMRGEGNAGRRSQFLVLAEHGHAAHTRRGVVRVLAVLGHARPLHLEGCRLVFDGLRHEHMQAAALMATQTQAARARAHAHASTSRARTHSRMRARTFPWRSPKTTRSSSP